MESQISGLKDQVDDYKPVQYEYNEYHITQQTAGSKPTAERTWTGDDQQRGDKDRCNAIGRCSE